MYILFVQSESAEKKGGINEIQTDPSKVGKTLNLRTWDIAAKPQGALFFSQGMKSWVPPTHAAPWVVLAGCKSVSYAELSILWGQLSGNYGRSWKGLSLECSGMQ